jgi:molecular chaperone GrpE
MTNDKSQMLNKEESKKQKAKSQKQEDVIARDEAIPLREASEGQVSENNEEKIDERQLEIDNLKNQLVRALADYQNQNKRFQEERAQIFSIASQNVLEALIPVLDILEKAQSHLKDQGLEMAIGQFKKVLSDEGLEEIVPEVHNPFDHETMEVVESLQDPERPEGVEGNVAEVVLNGWKFRDGKVVRFAKVKVFGGK